MTGCELISFLFLCRSITSSDILVLLLCDILYCIFLSVIFFCLYFSCFLSNHFNFHGLKKTVWTNYDIRSIIYQNGLMIKVLYLIFKIMYFFYTFISGYSLYFLVFIFISFNSHGHYKNAVSTNYEIHSIINQMD